VTIFSRLNPSDELYCFEESRLHFVFGGQHALRLVFPFNVPFQPFPKMVPCMSHFLMTTIVHYDWNEHVLGNSSIVVDESLDEEASVPGIFKVRNLKPTIVHLNRCLFLRFPALFDSKSMSPILQRLTPSFLGRFRVGCEGSNVF
jgi:hypothetical protein